MGLYDPARCVTCGGRITYSGFHCEWYHDKDPKERHLALPPADRSPGFYRKHMQKKKGL